MAHHWLQCWPGRQAKRSHLVEAFKATATEQGEEITFSCPSCDSGRITAVLEAGAGDERKDTAKAPSEKNTSGGFIWRLLPSNNSFVQVTHSQTKVISADFLIYSSKIAVHNKSSTGFSNVFIHRGSFCNLKVLNARGLPLTGKSRWEKQAFSDVKGTITEERYYADTFIFRAVGSNEGNTVVPRTIWNT